MPLLRTLTDSSGSLSWPFVAGWTCLRLAVSRQNNESPCWVAGCLPEWQRHSRAPVDSPGLITFPSLRTPNLWYASSSGPEGRAPPPILHTTGWRPQHRWNLLCQRGPRSEPMSERGMRRGEALPLELLVRSRKCVWRGSTTKVCPTRFPWWYACLPTCPAYSPPGAPAVRTMWEGG